MRIGIAVALHGVRELAFAFAGARLASPDLGTPHSIWISPAHGCESWLALPPRQMRITPWPALRARGRKRSSPLRWASRPIGGAWWLPGRGDSCRDSPGAATFAKAAALVAHQQWFC